MKSLVSLIIPVYNGERYLEKCMNSIIMQTYKNIEVILINDGSSDKSKEILDRFSKRDKRIKVIHKKNEGVSIARNIGLNLSTGEYIFFIDSDDYLDETVISDMMQYSNEYNVIKVGYKLIGENKKEINTISRNKLYKNYDYIKEVLSTDIGGQSWGYLLHKSIVKGIYFDSNTSCMEDTIFIIKCILRTDNIKCIDSSYYNYLINQQGITCSSKKIFKNIEDYMYSVNEIEKIIINRKINYDYRGDLLKKKITLIESEVSKIVKKEDLNILLKNKEINAELKNIKNSINLNIVYKIFSYLIVNKKYFMTMSYIRTRRLLKRIIKGR